MSGDAELLLLIAGVHIFGFVAVGILMLPALRDGWSAPPGPTDSDDGGGRGPKVPPIVPVSPSGGGLPLPDAIPARVRLREHGRLADHLPARERRPAHDPAREPVRTPSRT